MGGALPGPRHLAAVWQSAQFRPRRPASGRLCPHRVPAPSARAQPFHPRQRRIEEVLIQVFSNGLIN